MSKKILIGIVVVAVIAIIAVVVVMQNKSNNTDEANKNEVANKVEEQENNSTENNNEETANIEGSLEEIMDKLYVGIPDEERPTMLESREVTKEDIANYVGTSDIDFKEALVSEPGINVIPHSVVLLRLNDAKDASDVVAKIKENANPRKWICVEAENTIVKSKGDLVILIMSNELAETIDTNFEGLK